MRKQEQKTKVCGDCIHEFACSMWNVGTMYDADASCCVNYETARDFIVGFDRLFEEIKKENAKNAE